MPEIKNTFTQGKMNKDLDERIVPNGQYRDAMNIQVSTSEGSDVGAVQNILGNSLVNINYDTDGTTVLESSVVGDGWECVGSIADEKNDVLYSFIAHENGRSAILEISKDNEDVTPVLVDLDGSVLGFSQGDIITGINVIDDLLLWTDGTSEPKKINIQRCKDGSGNDLSTHTGLIVDGEQPYKETLSIIEGQWSGQGVGTTQINFYNDQIQGLKIGDQLLQINHPGVWNFLTSPSTPQTILVTFVDYSSGLVTLDTPVFANGDWSVGDTAIFRQYQNVEEEHITVIKKKPLKPLSVKIIPADSSDKKPLFEKIFPRFSYRYRYTDGEYSAFAPFTDVVFNSEYPDNQDGIPYDENTAYDTKEPYNAGMRNMIKSIELTDFVSPMIPDDVVQIDILYKQENSSVVYVLEILKDSDPEWMEIGSNISSSYKGKFIVKSENIYAAVPSNQLLRPWDNVPRKALAQEITGNRVIYGNYTQGYNLGIGGNNKPISPKLVSGYKLRFDEHDTLHTGEYVYSENFVDNFSFDVGVELDGWYSPSYGAVWSGGAVDWSGVPIDAFLHYENMGGNPTNANNPQGNWGPAGTTYRVSFNVYNYQSGNLRIQITNGNWNSPTTDPPADSSGAIDIDLSNYSAGSTFAIEKEISLDQLKVSGAHHGRFWFRSGSSLGGDPFNGEIDNVIIQEKTLDPSFRTFSDVGFPSVKYQRNYQLGIVYGDKYGRETPVFTSSDSSIVIPWESNIADTPLASHSLQLKTYLTSQHPIDDNGNMVFDYYKFFVKETSGEYYNLVMGAMYNPTKSDLQTDDHVWISFASSDRSKVSKDDYIILKKKVATTGEESEQIL